MEKIIRKEGRWEGRLEGWNIGRKERKEKKSSQEKEQKNKIRNAGNVSECI